MVFRKYVPINKQGGFKTEGVGIACFYLGVGEHDERHVALIVVSQNLSSSSE